MSLREAARQLCDWSSDPWWREARYRAFHPNLTVEQIDKAVARVADVFDAKWIARAEPHPLWNVLTSRGTMPLEFLVDLGSDLLDVQGALRLPSVIKDLRVESHFDSARLELSLAALQRRAGRHIEFRPKLPNGRSADFIVAADEGSVYVEVKKLHRSDAQAAISRLSIELIVAMVEQLRNGPWSEKGDIGFEIEVSDDIYDVLGAGEEIDATTIRELISQLAHETAARAGLEVPIEFAVAQVLRVTIGANVEVGVRGPQLNPVADLKRMITKFLRDAGHQLHPGFPGILICQTGSILDPEITRICVEPLLRSQENARHVSTVLFLPVSSCLPERFSLFPPFSVFNSNATVAPQQLVVYQTLAEHFGIDAH